MHSDDVQLTEDEQRRFDDIAFRLVVADGMMPLAEPVPEPQSESPTVEVALPQWSSVAVFDDERPRSRRRFALMVMALTLLFTAATTFTHSTAAVSVVGLAAPLTLMAALVLAGGPCPGMRIAQRRRMPQRGLGD